MTDTSDKPIPKAGRAVIADPPGAATTLTMYSGDVALAELAIGPAECVALASDLLLAARRRYGRERRDDDDQHHD